MATSRARSASPHDSSRSLLALPASDGALRGRNELFTVILEDEGEYVRFTDYTWSHFEGGTAPTDTPIDLTIRVRRWLLEETQGQFRMRLVTAGEVEAALERLVEERRRGRKPWDPASLKDLHVPGVPRGDKHI